MLRIMYKNLIASSEASTHFRAGLKGRLEGLTFAETPLSAISRSNWSPESAQVRPLFKAPREDDSSFRADLEQSTPNERRFMNFVSRTKSILVPHQIHTYTELRQQIHDDLRIQHPEWVEPNGESPMCDSYEARLTEQLDTFNRRGFNARKGDFPSQ